MILHFLPAYLNGEKTKNVVEKVVNTKRDIEN